MGAGKSSVARQLKERFGGHNNALILYLHWTGEEFSRNVQKALDYENVIGELSD
jgi:hypothetical protein